MGPERAISLFRRAFGGRPTHLASAPGRTNLIGEHTDYNQGFVFPAAIDRRIWVAARVTGAATSLRSAERGRTEAFDVRALTPGKLDGWGRYVAGTAWALQPLSDRTLPNIEAAIASDLPIGSGVSSSAALEVAFACLWNELCGLGCALPELAAIAQKSENQFVGLECGIMDQMASATGVKDHAILLDTRSLSVELVPIPSDMCLVICDTRKPRNLTKTAYNERRSQCEQAALSLGVNSLRDVSFEDLQKHHSAMNDVHFRRARHVVSENGRVLQFRSALEQKDLEQIGRFMRESHESLRDDYEVSCMELDVMAEASWHDPDCIGARMTGAGFGGACIALVSRINADSFCDRVSVAYEERTGIQPEFHLCRADDGAFALLA